MMLDQQHRMPGIDQLVQRSQQPLDVRQVQARCRLVQDVNGVLRPLQLAELRRNLDPLRLAAGQSCRRLPQREVSQPQIVQDLDLLP
jgi:hypothetical protein